MTPNHSNLSLSKSVLACVMFLVSWTSSSCNSFVGGNGALGSGETVFYPRNGISCFRPADFAYTHSPKLTLTVFGILELAVSDEQKIERLTKLSQDVYEIDSQIFRLCEAYGNNMIDKAEYLKERQIITRWKAAVPEYLKQLELLRAASENYGKNQIQPAMRKVQKVLAINSRNDAAHNLMGKLWMENKDYDKALSEFETAHAIDESEEDYIYNMGSARQHKGGADNYQRAKEFYLHLLRVNGKHVYANWNLAEIYMQEKDYVKALEHYENIIRINVGLIDKAWLRVATIHQIADRRGNEEDYVMDALDKAFSWSKAPDVLCQQIRKSNALFAPLERQVRYVQITAPCRA